MHNWLHTVALAHSSTSSQVVPSSRRRNPAMQAQRCTHNQEGRSQSRDGAVAAVRCRSVLTGPCGVLWQVWAQRAWSASEQVAVQPAPSSEPSTQFRTPSHSSDTSRHSWLPHLTRWGPQGLGPPGNIEGSALHYSSHPKASSPLRASSLSMRCKFCTLYSKSL